jgi:signal transduction histidine kinase
VGPWPPTYLRPAPARFDGWQAAGFWTTLQATLSGVNECSSVEVERDFPTIGRRTMLLDAQRLLRGVDALLLLVLRDITSHKQAEEALKHASRRKDEFLAMLGHELRNPLAPITNAVQVLKCLSPTSPEQRQMCEVLDRQTQHLTRLVDDLLDVARIANGKIALRREMIDLRSIIQRSLEICRPLFAARKQQLSVELPNDPVYLEGDLTRLVQVIGNLLTNAAKYTHESGHIVLQVFQRDGVITVSVTDNGMGLSTELLPHVFELFTQADRAIDRAEGGLGLGLTLVRRLVELHSGTVEARSAGLGKGSVFIVRLPAHS